MAKPIRATPTLRGNDAKAFLKEWTAEIRNPSKERVKFIKDAEKKRNFYLQFIDNYD